MRDPPRIDVVVLVAVPGEAKLRAMIDPQTPPIEIDAVRGPVYHVDLAVIGAALVPAFDRERPAGPALVGAAAPSGVVGDVDLLDGDGVPVVVAAAVVVLEDGLDPVVLGGPPAVVGISVEAQAKLEGPRLVDGGRWCGEGDCERRKGESARNRCMGRPSWVDIHMIGVQLYHDLIHLSRTFIHVQPLPSRGHENFNIIKRLRHFLQSEFTKRNFPTN